MALVSTTAFILRADALSEKDVAVSLLTPDHGTVRAAVRGARGKSRKGALLQLLNEVAVTFFRREGAELARVESLELASSSFALASRPEDAMLLPYLAEGALVFVPEGQAQPEVYRLVRHVLDSLSAGVPADVAARYFEVWLLRLAGLLPADAVCAACGGALDGEVRLAPEVPGLVHPACAGPGALPLGEAARAALRLARKPLPAFAASGVPEAALRELEGLCREVRRRFLGHELKSYRFLRALG